MTDVVMPEMNGRDLAKNLQSIYPDIKRLFMSGYTADVIAHKGILDKDVVFIQKPFSSKDLGMKLDDVLVGREADEAMGQGPTFAVAGETVATQESSRSGVQSLFR